MRRLGKAAAGMSARGAQAIVILPLALATFALVLQFSSRNQEAQPVTLPGLTGEAAVHSELAQFTQLPERALARAGDSLSHLLGADKEWMAQNPGVPKDWRLGADFQPYVPATEAAELPKIAFMTTTADSFRQIQLWTQYHRAVGVELFYLFVDGQAAQPDVLEQLRGLPGVTVVPKTPELKYKQEHSRIWNETWLSAFFHKPCNHELFVQQSLNMEEGIKLARADGADWVLHIDTDELMYPGGAPQFSLQAILAAVPPRVDNVIFPNYESMPERDDITDPFTQVTLFKRNFHHVVSETYFKGYKTVSRGNPNYFITYGNGKSAARMQRGLRPNGAHRWFNYVKHPREITHETAAVLHFTFNRFSDLKSRRDRCDCAPTEEDAKRCFILPFDRLAFLAASLKTDDELKEWFRQRLVWNDPAVVKELVKNGLFYRIYTPQVLIRGFLAMDEKAEAAAKSGGGPAAAAAGGSGGRQNKQQQRQRARKQEEVGSQSGGGTLLDQKAVAVDQPQSAQLELADTLQTGGVDAAAEPGSSGSGEPAAAAKGDGLFGAGDAVGVGSSNGGSSSKDLAGSNDMAAADDASGGGGNAAKADIGGGALGLAEAGSSDTTVVESR